MNTFLNYEVYIYVCTAYKYIYRLQYIYAYSCSLLILEKYTYSIHIRTIALNKQTTNNKVSTVSRANDNYSTIANSRKNLFNL